MKQDEIEPLKIATLCGKIWDFEQEDLIIIRIDFWKF